MTEQLFSDNLFSKSILTPSLKNKRWRHHWIGGATHSLWCILRGLGRIEIQSKYINFQGGLTALFCIGSGVKTWKKSTKIEVLTESHIILHEHKCVNPNLVQSFEWCRKSRDNASQRGPQFPTQTSQQGKAHLKHSNWLYWLTALTIKLFLLKLKQNLPCCNLLGSLNRD